MHGLGSSFFNNSSATKISLDLRANAVKANSERCQAIINLNAEDNRWSGKIGKVILIYPNDR